MRHLSKCLNCATPFNDDDNFCHHCGQSAKVHSRITMHHVTHEVIHALTHADKGFLYMIKELATQPGITIKEFLAGKHKKFFNPFSFFFIVLGIYVLSNSFFKPFDQVMKEDTVQNGKTVTIPAKYKTAKQREKYLKIQARIKQVSAFMNDKTNIVLCLSTPFIAFIMFLLFRKDLFYAEHLVAVTFINSFLSLVSILVFNPLGYILGGSLARSLIPPILILTHIIYMSIAYFKVLQLPNTFAGYFKTVGSVTLAILCWTAFWGACILAYAFFGILFFEH